jgi:hypothetical protein
LRVTAPERPIPAAFAVNELTDDARTLVARFLEHGSRGGHVLVIEPIATSIAPWWADGAAPSKPPVAGQTRARTHPLPAIVEKPDRALSRIHRELTARYRIPDSGAHASVPL